MSAAGLALFAAASIIIVAGGSFLAVPWWRHYFRRVFDARMQLQEDGSYLAHWIRRGWKGEVYRIDALTKQRVLDGLTAGSVLSTALFVVLLVAAVAISVVCAMPIIAPAAMLLAPFAFAPQRRADREARRLILTITRVDGAEAGPPSRASAGAHCEKHSPDHPFFVLERRHGRRARRHPCECCERCRQEDKRLDRRRAPDPSSAAGGPAALGRALQPVGFAAHALAKECWQKT
ncbi:MAG: hypothetical protein JOY97_07835 [Hyphomicrobiales bacterium]|nr:hypothetical protein [Hyphomicrobiales bacterium]